MSSTSRETNREARDRKVAQAKAQAEAARKRARTTRIAAAVIVVLLVVGVVVFLAVRKDTVSSDAALPKGVSTSGGGIVTGAGPAALDIYEDFQCPACRDFEKANATTLGELAAQGTAKVIYHPMHFLDDSFESRGTTVPNPGSSRRAANAAACAADQGKFTQFHAAAYAAQPAKEGDGFSDAQLKAVGTTAGVAAGPLAQCMKADTYGGWVDQVERESRDRGITATPTVLLNGSKLDFTKVISTDAAGNQAFDKAKWFAVVKAAGTK